MASWVLYAGGVQHFLPTHRSSRLSTSLSFLLKCPFHSGLLTGQTTASNHSRLFSQFCLVIAVGY
jgi:hypothetical protein